MKAAQTYDEWLTLREAAVHLRRSYGQILRLLELGALESRRTSSGRWFVTTESVARLARHNARREATQEN